MASHLIGVDLGGTNLRVGLLTLEREVLACKHESTKNDFGADGVVTRTAELIEEVLVEQNVAKNDVIAVGVGAPGPLDGKRGIVIEAPNLGWRNYPFASVLHQKTGLEVILENDANCHGWGEFWAGAGQGCNTMVQMTLGTGIGGAIILDGKLWRGPDGTAAEFGHVIIQDGGRPAATGNRGALEAYASATATVARFKEALRYGWRSDLGETNLDALTCKDIFEAAKAGDGLAMHIVTETGRYLGVMAANLANLLNPDRCIFSGGMIHGGDILFNAIREECNRRAFPVPASRMKILPAKLGKDAGIIGAAGVAYVAVTEGLD